MRQGYVRACVDGVLYYAHRLAWLHHHGEWPAEQLDHINGDRQDNRIANLRLASQLENHQNRKLQRNNVSGHPGVYFEKGRWRARIKVQQKYRHLGTFDTFEEARAARIFAKEAMHQFNPVDRLGITG